MRTPRTSHQSRWHVFGLALVLLVAPLLSPILVAADAGTAGTPSAASSETRVISEDVRLRTTPSLDGDVLTVVAAGTSVTFTGEVDGVFAKVQFGDATGWVDASYLLEGADAGTVTPPASDPDARTVLEDLSLRSEADPDSELIGILAAGEIVFVTGDVSDIYAEVNSGIGTGWVVAEYLLESVDPDDVPAPGVSPTAVTGTQTPATTVVPGDETPTSEPTAVPSSTAVTETPTMEPTVTPGDETPTTEPTVTPDDETPTVVPTAEPTEETPSPTETPEPTRIPVTPAPTAAPSVTATVPSGTSLVVWPVKGGQWEVSQGYNGSSHQNDNSLWQYRDSFDLVPSSGAAAGQTVYSPVNGTIKWFDPSTGGIAIDMGGGFAFAMFHMDVDGSLAVGQSITQGQVLGTIAGPGGGGNGGFPHLHITAWSTNDGGNWDRHSVPFTGVLAISGAEFPNTGESFQWTGYTFTP